MYPVFNIKSEKEFKKIALEAFRQQYWHVQVYHEFVNHLKINPGHIQETEDIPFLPVELFRNHKILDSRQTEEIVFSSSGTTGMDRSRHFVADKELYRQSFTRGFELFYGNPSEYCILALLPSYLEREGSSLIFMMEELVKQSGHPDSGFYLYEYDKLMLKVEKLKKKKQKTILLGVTFALLELSDKFQEDLSDIIIMETGGMKGRGKEITREELHMQIKKSFNVENVHSEYGMTELLSQAYSKGNGKFHCPPWMKVLIRDTHDPFNILGDGHSGMINIIDLANIQSCSFIATSDLGKKDPEGSFEILGRMDNSDIRGCNLLVAM
jgi:phenylacetate-coenzyme A ligase PaaK-like adenylate-forming protein